MVERITSPNVSKLHSYDTEFSADSIEWCPHEPNQNKFVCANYKLIEQAKSGDPKRIGKIYLFSIEHKEKLITHQVLETKAILDQKWCHNLINNHSILGTVDANNELNVYKLMPDGTQLDHITKFKNDWDGMLLSLDFSTGKYSSNSPTIVTSDTKGQIHIFRLTNNELILETSLNGHEFEAWICAFYYWNKSIIFSGGDDSKLLKFDLRVGKEPVTKSRAHNAGVTCIHSNKEQEHLVATGSYDQNLHLWDIRSMKTPLNSLEMPGPMWRLKWDPQTHSHLLAACMLGGFHIINTSPVPEIIANYYEHSDLAYGSDWCHLNEDQLKKYSNNNRIFAACSFYDNKMSVASVDLKK